MSQKSKSAPRRGRRAPLFAALLALAVGVAAYFYVDYRHFANSPLAPLAAAISVDVPLGTPLPGIVRLLEADGIHTAQPLYWRMLARELGVAGRLHAGEYALAPGITPRGLLAKMAAGDVVQHRFTIVEGWTFAQLRSALAQDDGLTQALAGVGDAESMRLLGDADTLPEGWFLPETYSYVKGMSDLDILRRAHEAMHKALARLWGARDPGLPLDTPYQALILASIVEKETARADERAQIAEVFEHRLKLGMKLQTDPSVIYGLGAGYDGNIHRRDLDTDTPFNTYTRTGLPPTPIALPGTASLIAVMHPATSGALYFVARGDGSQEFSATLEAHNRAVAKYQLHRNQ
ncbi:MAG: endolytic transglycosylase MltG [Rudaea sp.]|nr:endolytic transglycosylase MltG [Rudaea sp.]